MGYSLMCLMVFLFASCQRELLHPKDLSVVVSPGVQIPLAHVYLDMEDILPLDSTLPLQIQDAPYYILSYQMDSLFALQAADLMDLPNQSPVSLQTSLGQISLPDVNASAGISLGYFGNSITNPSTFGSALAAANGTSSVFPAIPTQNPGPLSMMTLGGIQSVDFTSGTMTMQLVNHFPAAFHATVVLADMQGNEWLTFSFVNVAPGDSATDSENLAGLQLPGTLQVILKNVSSPGAGTPGIPSTYIPIDTSATLSLTAHAAGMTISTATAVTQTQIIVDRTLWMSFAAPSGVEISEIAWQSGQLDYTIASGFTEDVQITFGLPGSSVNGGAPWEQTLVVLKNTSVFGAFSWAGLAVDLTQDSSQPFNQIPLNYEVTLISSGQTVTVDSSQNLSFTLGLQNLDLDYVYGFFGQDSFLLPQDTLTLDFPVLDRLQGSIAFTDPSLIVPIAFNTMLGIPMEVDLALATQDKNGVTTTLTGNNPSILGIPVNASSIGTIGYNNLIYHAQNSNIENLLSWPKSALIYGGAVFLNPDTAQWGRFNYLSQTSGMEVGLQLTLPFSITASGLRFTDSVDVSGLQTALFQDSSWATSARLQLHSKSRFPIDAALNLHWFDAQGNLLWAETVPLVHSGVLDANGFVVQPTEATDEILLDRVALEQMAMAKWLQLEATLETTASGQEPVKLETTSSLELHVGLQVEFEKEIL